MRRSTSTRHGRHTWIKVAQWAEDTCRTEPRPLRWSRHPGWDAACSAVCLFCSRALLLQRALCN